MNANQPAARRSLKSDLARIGADAVRPEEYEELPELTEEMLVRAKVNKGGRPVSPNPRKLISLRLPADVIEPSNAGRLRPPAGKRAWLNG